MNTHQIDIFPNGSATWKYHCHTCARVIGYAVKAKQGAFRVRGEGAWGAMVTIGAAPNLLIAERIIRDNHTN